MRKPLLYTTRTETDGVLTLAEGVLPSDLAGVFYVAYPVGTVNSGGLPFPEKHSDGTRDPEFASPIMNGDGMAVKITFGAGRSATVRSRLLKTPCYYADYNTRYGEKWHKIFGFRNFGISRMSLALGARNEVNTALIPVQFGDEHPYLLATYDVGRPFAADADSLELKTAVGWNREWVAATPEMVPWPFGLVQTTAHPSFDPRTKELFSVNYTRSSIAMLFEKRLFYFLKNDPEQLEKKMEALAREVKQKSGVQGFTDRIGDFFKNLPEELERPDPFPGPTLKESAPGEVWLLRWTGAGDWERWQLHDAAGKPIEIEECMHQTAITQDYIVLTDCSFKFSIDLLINNPFPQNEEIDRMIRRHLARPMVPETECYIVKRRDLKAGGGKVTAYKLDQPIPVETIHYSCNYANPDGKITFLGVHNAAVCIAEWVRSYDIDKLTGQPVDPELYSLFSIGSMDVSRLGKWIIDGENARLLPSESSQFVETGDWRAPRIGPNTWGIGLYTHRDMLSPTAPVETIEQLWYTSVGIDRRMLTEFIYDLYKDYPNRIVRLPDLLEATKKGLPFSLTRLNVKTMRAEDYYQAPENTYLRSLHFMPRNRSTPDLDPALDGYLVIATQAGYVQPDGRWRYRGEFWIFDAADIARGPLCKLYHPDIQFAFTLHTAVLPAALPFNAAYTVDVRQDYDAAIQNLFDADLLKLFFEDYVYPNYPSGEAAEPPKPGNYFWALLADALRFLRKVWKKWFG